MVRATTAVAASTATATAPRAPSGPHLGPQELDGIGDEGPVEHGVERASQHLVEPHVDGPAHREDGGGGRAERDDDARPPAGQGEGEPDARERLDREAQERRDREVPEPVRRQEHREHEDQGGGVERPAGTAAAPGPPRQPRRRLVGRRSTRLGGRLEGEVLSHTGPSGHGRA